MNRKDDHIKLTLVQQPQNNDFDKIRFIHNGVNLTSLSEVDLSTMICNKILKYPIFINAMTGGSKLAKEINNKLSLIANHFNIPIASGSLSIALKDSIYEDSFTIIRDNNKDGIVISNIGADKTVKDALRAIRMLNADILQIHINKAQELIMPEGERDFKNWQNNIKSIIEEVDIPVIVKEVGFGMSRKTIDTLKGLGVKTVDISGKGGTNFAKIENARREKSIPYLNDWGLSTVESLLEASGINDIEILASGGIRNALDIVKSLALGANAVGLSSYFLKLVTNKNIDEAIKEVEGLFSEIKIIMTMLGCNKINDLRDVELIFDESLYSFIQQRKIEKFI